ncbi:fumarylacetoacetate hydrolase family protein [Microvirga alba]|uniref:Fumarylacetoacetate hydrolase family protein n=1 Tax=Microvirga alba TaxID=2791025 RepID=A0A931BUA9_9HYPH|nr:fumarylacetoacetate hydrolase family protein [Microvirga alba]MBF9234858.1 fumarylacetoacetate hydrolase family protein [Microvirga alba]
MTEYKLGTAVVDGASKPVVLVQGRVFTLAEVLGKGGAKAVPASLIDVFGNWEAQRSALSAALKDFRAAGGGRDPESLVYQAPVPNPRAVICVGVNYRDHLAEMKVSQEPSYPYAFLRPPSSLAAHREEIRLPKGPQMVDWEAELGIVVGRRVPAGDTGDAFSAVAGYTVVNDVSARDWIINRPPVGIDWVMQKAWDQFQPTGPWVTPAEFVPDPQALSIELSVNGIVKQRSNTGQMIFGVRQIMQHLAGIMTLEPGDIVATGTPAGVGFGQSPQEFIQTGDQVCVTVERLGTLENRFI